jgi:hypothetical protein
MAVRAAHQVPVAAVPPVEALLLALLQAQHEIVSELRGLRADLAARERDLPCHDDVRFVAAIAASVQGRVFSLMELRAHARRVDSVLQRAIGTLTNQQLGKKLRDLAGRDFGGLVVERVTRDASGVIWAVSVAPDLHGHTGAAAE